jgi:hypothetical protein
VGDSDLPPLQVAEQRLVELSGQRRNLLVAAVALAILAIPVGLAYRQLGVALAMGGVAALAGALIVHGRLRALLGKLIQVRDAYRIEIVSRAGRRFASPVRRARLAQSLRDAVNGANGAPTHTHYTVAPLVDRVQDRRERLLAVGDALDGNPADLHPAGVVIVHRLLTRPGHSPLYNPDLDETRLDDALHRVESCRGAQITP